VIDIMNEEEQCKTCEELKRDLVKAEDNAQEYWQTFYRVEAEEDMKEVKGWLEKADRERDEYKALWEEQALALHKAEGDAKTWRDRFKIVSRPQGWKYDGNLAAHVERGYELRDIGSQLRESADKAASRDFRDSLTSSDRSAIAASAEEDKRLEEEAAEKAHALYKAKDEAKTYKLFFRLAAGAIVLAVLQQIFS
jgi:hypothetical protein